jgi:hypothetical protein
MIMCLSVSAAYRAVLTPLPCEKWLRVSLEEGGGLSLSEKTFALTCPSRGFSHTQDFCTKGGICVGGDKHCFLK